MRHEGNPTVARKADKVVERLIGQNPALAYEVLERLKGLVFLSPWYPLDDKKEGLFARYAPGIGENGITIIKKGQRYETAKWFTLDLELPRFTGATVDVVKTKVDHWLKENGVQTIEVPGYIPVVKVTAAWKGNSREVAELWDKTRTYMLALVEKKRGKFVWKTWAVPRDKAITGMGQEEFKTNDESEARAFHNACKRAENVLSNHGWVVGQPMASDQ